MTNPEECINDKGHTHLKVGLTYLCHYHVLAFLDIFAICLHNGLQKTQVFHMAAVCLDAAHKVLHYTLANFIAQVVIVRKDVSHGFSLKKLI